MLNYIYSIMSAAASAEYWIPLIAIIAVASVLEVFFVLFLLKRNNRGVNSGNLDNVEETKESLTAVSKEAAFSEEEEQPSSIQAECTEVEFEQNTAETEEVYEPAEVEEAEEAEEYVEDVKIEDVAEDVNAECGEVAENVEESSASEAYEPAEVEETEEIINEENADIEEMTETSEDLADSEGEATTESDRDDEDVLSEEAQTTISDDDIEDAIELEKIVHPDEAETSEAYLEDNEACDTEKVDSTALGEDYSVEDETQSDSGEEDYSDTLKEGANLVDDEVSGGGKLFFGGKEITVRYLRSFTAKLVQSNDLVKERYSVLKNELLSYKKAKARTSWHFETVRLGRPAIAKFAIRGKTLSLYLALDPEEFQDTKYIYKDVSDVKKYSQVPMRLKIKSNRSVRWAKELISKMAEKNGYKRIEKEEVDYYPEYRTTKELVMDKLIKLQGAKAQEEYDKLQQDDKELQLNETNYATLDEVAATLDDANNDFTVVGIETADTKELHDVPPMAVILEVDLEAALEESVESTDGEPLTVDEPVVTEESSEEELAAKEEPSIIEEAPEIIEEPLKEEEPVSEEPVVPLAERDFEIVREVSVTRADKNMSNEKAESLIEDVVVEKVKYNKGNAKVIINIDTLSQNYKAGETVTLENLVEKKLLPKKAGYLKVLGRGVINKPLVVEADEFSINAAKMILLTGGRVVRDA